MTYQTRLIATLTAGLACLGLYACGGGEETGTPADSGAGMSEPQAADTERNYPQGAYVYQCGGTEAAAIFETAERLTLIIGENDYSLLSVVADEGARFVAANDETTSFAIRGQTATLSLDGEDYPECSLEREPI